MLLEFDHAQNLAGSEFAMRRFEKYRGLVFWKEKEIYMRTMIYRAHRKHDSNPCALYAAWQDGNLLVSENLSGIKAEIKARKTSIDLAKEKVKAEGLRSLKDRIELEGADMNSAYPKVVN